MEITNNINNQERIYRKHLRLKIVNRGKGIATDCKAKFRIRRWNKGVRYPSTNSKTLVWDDNTIAKEIYPHGEDEVLNIVFADSDLGKLAENSSLDIYAFVATDEAYNGRSKSAQDGFGKGEFEAELSVKSKEGGYCKAELLIHIDSDYLKIDMKLSFFDTLILAYRRSPSVVALIHSLPRGLMNYKKQNRRLK